MTNLKVGNPEVDRALGKIILAVRELDFQDAFLTDCRESLLSLDMDDGIRATVIENMASSGLSPLEMLATILPDGSNLRKMRDILRG